MPGVRGGDDHDVDESHWFGVVFFGELHIFILWGLFSWAFVGRLEFGSVFFYGMAFLLCWKIRYDMS